MWAFRKGERINMTLSHSSVPETLTASELEGFVAGVVGPESLKPTEGASVGEDVEEAQELAVDATKGADHARQDVVRCFIEATLKHS